MTAPADGSSVLGSEEWDPQANQDANASASKALLQSLQAEMQALNRNRRAALGGHARRSPAAQEVPNYAESEAQKIPSTSSSASASPSAETSSQPVFSRTQAAGESRSKEGLPCTAEALKAEATVLGRAHRALRCGIRPVHRLLLSESPTVAHPRGPLRAGRRSSSQPSSPAGGVHDGGELVGDAVGGSSCPFCGGCVDRGVARTTRGASPKSLTERCQQDAVVRAADSRTSKSAEPEGESSERDQRYVMLSAKLELTQALLEKAEPEAAVATELRQELDAERSRSVDLAEALCATRQLAEELHAGYVAQAKEFKDFVARVRATAHRAAPNSSLQEALRDTVALAWSSLRQTEEVYKEEEARASDARHVLELRHCLAEQSERLESAQYDNMELQFGAEAFEEELHDAVEEYQAASHDLVEQRAQLASAEEEVSAAAMEISALREQLLQASADLEEKHSELLSSRNDWTELEHSIAEGTLAEERAHELQQAEVRAAQSKHQQMKDRAARLRTKRLEKESSLRREEGCQAVATLMRETSKGGVKVLKLSARRRKWQTRFIGLVHVGKGFEVRWSESSKGLQAKSWSTTCLRMKDITRVDFGDSLPVQMHPSQCKTPWLCFAFYTCQRSFCFWTDNPNFASALIVGVSMLAPSAPPVTPREVLWRRAVCKIGKDKQCRAKAILRAAQKAKSDLARSGRLFGILKKTRPAGAVQRPSPGSSPNPSRRVTWGRDEIREVAVIELSDDDSAEGNDAEDNEDTGCDSEDEEPKDSE